MEIAASQINLSYNLGELDDVFENYLELSSIPKSSVDNFLPNTNTMKCHLDKFFDKAKCRRFIITQNTDKQFFGIKVYPNISADQAVKFAIEPKLSDAIPICESYDVELDSNIFNLGLGLIGREVTAFVVYAIYKSLFAHNCLGGFECEIADYCYDTETSLSMISRSSARKELFLYGFKDVVAKNGNPFYVTDGEYFLDESFLKLIGYNADMYNCLYKIISNISFFKNYMDKQWYTLAWVLRLCNEYDTLRIPMYKTLIKAADLTGSQLEKEEILRCAKLLQQTSVLENSMGIVSDISRDDTESNPSSLGYLQVKPLKNEIFLLAQQLKNEKLTSDDIRDIINQINNAIHTLETVISDELSYTERKEVEYVIDQYKALLELCYDKKVLTDRNHDHLPILFHNW